MSEEEQQWIIRKIDGELSLEEEAQFQQRLQLDTRFAQEYALQQNIIDGLRDDHEQQLKRRYREVYEAVAHRREQRRRYFAVAAVVSLLIMAVAGYFLMRPPSSESLYAEYYSPYRADPLLRGESDHETLYQRAMDLYRREQYQAAIPLLETSLSSDTLGQDKLSLFLGNSYLNENKISSAIAYFERASRSRDPVMQQFGKWYLALSYLKNDDLLTTRRLLESIASQPGIHQDRAQTLLEEIPL